MDGVDNKYIDNAITVLVSTIGVKECVDSKKIVSLMRSKKVKEAIKEIAKYLGLPIEVNLSYVPKGYRPNATDGFHSTHIVKTDWKGQGTGGIIAQVSIPSNLPFYGSPQMVNFPISVRVSENCTDNPTTFVTVMAHELSHIVLHSIWHKEKENEFYTDLTAMMLGFAKVMKKGRKVVTTKTESLIVATRTTTTTTSYGYLSDENFTFAFGKVGKILKTCEQNKSQFAAKINGLERMVRKQKAEMFYFKRYLTYLDKNLSQNISQQDGQWIYSFHQPGYTEEFESAVQNAENEIKQFASFVRNLIHYNENRLGEITKYEERIRSIGTDLNSKYDRIRGAVIILKRYVSMGYRLQSFLGAMTTANKLPASR